MVFTKLNFEMFGQKYTIFYYQTFYILNAITEVPFPLQLLISDCWRRRWGRVSALISKQIELYCTVQECQCCLRPTGISSWINLPKVCNAKLLSFSKMAKFDVSMAAHLYPHQLDSTLLTLVRRPPPVQACRA